MNEAMSFIMHIAGIAAVFVAVAAVLYMTADNKGTAKAHWQDEKGGTDEIL